MRYALALIAPLALVAGAMLALFLLSLGQPTPSVHGDVLAVGAKVARAQAQPSPKILLVGGSGVLFSLNAEEVEKQTGVPTVNLGVDAGFGDFIFYYTRQAAGPGDVVVLALEFPFYHDRSNPYLNTESAGISLGYGAGYFWSLSDSDRMRYLRMLSLERLWEGARARLLGFDPQQAPHGYELFTDRYGDIDFSLVPPAKLRLDQELLRKSSLPGYQSGSQAVQHLEAFLDWCRQRGVRVLATWPSLPAIPVFNEPAAQNAYAGIQAFYARRDIPLLGSPQDFQLPPELFYDTIYHPQREGNRLRTQRLIAFLRPRLAALGIVP